MRFRWAEVGLLFTAACSTPADVALTPHVPRTLDSIYVGGTFRLEAVNDRAVLQANGGRRSQPAFAYSPCGAGPGVDSTFVGPEGTLWFEGTEFFLTADGRSECSFSSGSTVGGGWPVGARGTWTQTRDSVVFAATSSNAVTRGPLTADGRVFSILTNGDTVRGATGITFDVVTPEGRRFTLRLAR